MGGRDTWSKPTDSGFTGYDYHKVFQFYNTHYLVQHDHKSGGVSAPVMSKTSDVTYVTMGEDGKPKCISVYKNRIKQYEIDLNKPHHGMLPHVHHCNELGYRKKEKDSEMHLTKEMQRKVKVIMKTYTKYKKEICV